MGNKQPSSRRKKLLKVIFLLDTDVLIWILRGNKQIIDKVLSLKDTSEFAISVISIAEIYKNIFPAELTATEDFLNQHIILGVDQRIAKLAGLYFQQYSKHLKNLGLMDCLVAGTANTYDATLVSLNTKHFPMKDIKLLNLQD